MPTIINILRFIVVICPEFVMDEIWQAKEGIVCVCEQKYQQKYYHETIIIVYSWPLCYNKY